MEHEDEGKMMARVPQHFTQNLTDNLYQKTAPSVFSPGEFYIPRLFSGSMKIHF